MLWIWRTSLCMTWSWKRYTKRAKSPAWRHQVKQKHLISQMALSTIMSNNKVSNTLSKPENHSLICLRKGIKSINKFLINQDLAMQKSKLMGRKNLFFIQLTWLQNRCSNNCISYRLIQKFWQVIMGFQSQCQFVYFGI